MKLPIAAFQPAEDRYDTRGGEEGKKRKRTNKWNDDGRYEVQTET